MVENHEFTEIIINNFILSDDLPKTSGIVTSANIPGVKPYVLTKKDCEEVIEAFKKNPYMFKKDRPRWQ